MAVEEERDSGHDSELSPRRVTEVPSLNEPAAKHTIMLQSLAKSNREKCNEICQAFRRDLQGLHPIDSADELIITPVDICHLTASYLDKTLIESVKRIAQFSATSVEQMLRVVESFLIDEDTEIAILPEQVLKKAAYLFSLSVSLSQDLTAVSNSFIDCIHSLSEEGKASFQHFAKSEKGADESSKCSEDIEIKMGLHVNHIYLDSSNAVTSLQECRKFLFPICKCLLASNIRREMPMTASQASTEHCQAPEEKAVERKQKKSE